MKTVFIIGAGASSEAGLPTGEKLKQKIINFLDFRFNDFGFDLISGDRAIFDALQLLSKKGGQDYNRCINEYIKEAQHIRDALPFTLSIDNFIDAQKGNEKLALCGKLAIVRSILEEEKTSHFSNRKGYIFTYLENTWYKLFFQLLTENCGIGDIEKRLKDITLIIFNYDRCIEHFLYFTLQNFYRINEKEAIEFVCKTNIYHPYGVVGALPWSNIEGPKMAFGNDPNPQELLDLSVKIKTFSEGTDPTASDIVAIKRNMAEAERIIFLGYAFHKLNMALIKPSKEQGKHQNIECYASTYEISDSDKKVIESQIKALYPQRMINVTMANKKCYEFIKDQWRSLSF